MTGQPVPELPQDDQTAGHLNDRVQPEADQGDRPGDSTSGFENDRIRADQAIPTRGRWNGLRLHVNPLEVGVRRPPLSRSSRSQCAQTVKDRTVSDGTGFIGGRSGSRVTQLRRPRGQNDLAAQAASVDAGVDLRCGGQR